MELSSTLSGSFLPKIVLASIQRFLRGAVQSRLVQDLVARERTGLRSRLLRAGGWNLGAHIAETLIRLATSLIMTRMLFPEAFGLMAFLLTILIGLSFISDLGVHLIVIRDEAGEDEGFLRCAWTVQLVRGFMVWL